MGRDLTVCAYSAGYSSPPDIASLKIHRHRSAERAEGTLDSVVSTLRGREVPGLGDGAVWVEGMGQLHVRRGALQLTVTVHAPQVDRPLRRRARDRRDRPLPPPRRFVTGAAALLAALALDLALLHPRASNRAASGAPNQSRTRSPSPPPAPSSASATRRRAWSCSRPRSSPPPPRRRSTTPCARCPGSPSSAAPGSRFANPTAQGASLRGLGGSGASRALVLADGVPLNDPFGGWIYWGARPAGGAGADRGAARRRLGPLRQRALAGVIQLLRREAAPAGLRRGGLATASSARRGFALRRRTRRGAWGASLAAEAVRTRTATSSSIRAERGPVDMPAASRH